MDNCRKCIESMSTSRYDVTIVCCTDEHQAAYWNKRLSLGLLRPKSSTSIFPLVLSVYEDWSPGGAGNGLGTLYAYHKACTLAKTSHSIDLTDLLKKGDISVGMYHTAGKGTRMAPLPASENNNKPAVRIGATIEVDGRMVPMTVLEAVIKQTSVYSPSRPGRLSVFWGDQVFIPNTPTSYVPRHHVDIMCTLGDMVGEKEWKEKGLEKYGVIAVSSTGAAAQVEKVSHSTACHMLKSLGDVTLVGPSLGSFSVSAQMTEGLMDEFKNEIEGRDGKMDTDPHFWMPMTLGEEDYVQLMKGKGVDVEVSTAHYARMSTFKSNFLASNPTMGIFGAVDVGTSACWWDYGQLKLYVKNNIKMIEEGEEADMLRMFMGMEGGRVKGSDVGKCEVDETTVVSSSSFKGGRVVGSVISNVNAGRVEADGSVMVNVTAKGIRAGKGSVVYNVVDETEGGIVVGEGEVMVGVWKEDGGVRIVRSRVDVDGGKMWKDEVEGNGISFEGIHEDNKGSDVERIERVRDERHEKVKGRI